jgi:hypothetical protein
MKSRIRPFTWLVPHVSAFTPARMARRDTMPHSADRWLDATT